MNASVMAMENKKLSILIVCMGNICRSPLSEAVLSQKAQQQGINLFVESAGTVNYQVGRKPDPKAISVAEQRGYSMSNLRARQVCSEDFEKFDLIFALDKANLADLIDICPARHKEKLSLFLSHSHIGVTEVPDPYKGNIHMFERVLELIESGAQGIIEHISKQYQLKESAMKLCV
ncbi:protein-tyrosine-phosphatase [Vibrio qinghaiensis]|uniref:protein-tyrosine-phosphatase n=3 Tax=Vibrio TaxID=662 RepID=A0A223MW93_9VIBR|nr:MULTISPECIES: low molecular weight protein-tyrosine-phosphatase [Vibrio]NAW89460.1 low molecular weight phosphotyrosine protein phosphatase [Vibrio sp. V24_P1S3T111]ASU21774.1 protein-tyrosine-phosphatase [Vibrio qinghaiensis]OXX20311.1 protein-tyrosine-phosphatase [Vibrio sp. V05_P4A8T149]OXX30944.1 protein-tyrosine-phosphatase [Vibrio sp. V14_P6S14T42]OXX37134.1 protein-tyrosine-phosphatase [Vibrio sp. V04_P4A5T148]